MRTLLLAVLLVPAPAAYAAGTQGATAFDFLSIDAAPRPAAMGGAYAAVADDADGMLYNPAGLAFLNEDQASFAHADYIQGITQDYLALAFRGGDGRRQYDDGRHWLSDGAGAGVYVNTLDFGGIQRTTLANQSGAGLDSFGVRDWALGAGYARRGPWSWLGFGGALKYLRENIDNTVAQTVALDMGARADLQEPFGVPFTAGLALQNLGQDPRYRVVREPMPTALRLGGAWLPNASVTIAADLVQVRGGALTPHAGVEWRAFESAALRMGYDGKNDAGPGITVGASVTWRMVRFDYAFVPYGDLGDAHRLGATVRW
ncbi:MAG: PorV/PorQ family protein [Elusimicrobiota bacterium]